MQLYTYVHNQCTCVVDKRILLRRCDVITRFLDLGHGVIYIVSENVCKLKLFMYFIHCQDNMITIFHLNDNIYCRALIKTPLSNYSLLVISIVVILSTRYLNICTQTRNAKILFRQYFMINHDTIITL